MNDTEIKIIDGALGSLKNVTGLEGTWEEAALKGKDTGIDGKLYLKLDKGGEKFYVEVKSELRNHQLPQIWKQAEKWKPLMVVATQIFPQLKEELRRQGIAYLDGAGNIFLRTPAQFVWVEGHKLPERKEQPASRIFGKAGLKVMFLFLQHAEFVNATYREIAAAAGVSLGSLNPIFKGLQEEGYLLSLDGKRYILDQKKELFEKWVTAYGQVLKPSLYVGNFRFLKKEDFQNWGKIRLKDQDTQWGGEPAGAILTNYLQPEMLTLYTTESKQDLIRNYRLIPDQSGPVKAYQKFWANPEGDQDLVPPLLVYADLMGTGDRRCIETAQKIYDTKLRNNF
ncbi:type IV toxin-antitoxin system AbiEi family antitoxin [soil metagenome]